MTCGLPRRRPEERSGSCRRSSVRPSPQTHLPPSIELERHKDELAVARNTSGAGQVCTRGSEYIATIPKGRSSMRAFVTASVAVALGLGVWGCSGNGYTSGNIGNPNTPTTSIPGVVTINLVAVNGAQSFSPNPASLPAGPMVVWHNRGTVTQPVV